MRRFTPRQREAIVAQYNAAPHGRKHIVLERNGITAAQLYAWRGPRPKCVPRDQTGDEIHEIDGRSYTITASPTGPVRSEIGFFEGRWWYVRRRCVEVTLVPKTEPAEDWPVDDVEDNGLD